MKQDKTGRTPTQGGSGWTYDSGTNTLTLKSEVQDAASAAAECQADASGLSEGWRDAEGLDRACSYPVVEKPPVDCKNIRPVIKTLCPK